MIYRLVIRGLQFLSIFLMWAFAASVLLLIVWLVLVAARWHDALNWTLAISLVMAPVYLTVAGTLTYVFIGLQRGARKTGEERPVSGEDGASSP
jgi:uncharacterized membrane protein YhaH (DUF805 family)